MRKKYPGKPPRLETVFPAYDPPLYFITFCTWQRGALLASEEIHRAFRDYAIKNEGKGFSLGRYALMPDHLHFFVQLARSDLSLGTFVKLMKQHLSKVLRQRGWPVPHWQPGFFDHLMRSGESYAEKWEYVRNNPVRAGLVKRPEDWPYQGEIVPLEFD